MVLLQEVKATTTKTEKLTTSVKNASDYKQTNIKQIIISYN